MIRTFHFGPSLPPSDQSDLKEKNTAGSDVQQLTQVFYIRGRGHVLPNPAFWAVLGLFFRSFSPMTGALEGDKKSDKNGQIGRGRGRISGQNE